MADNNINGGDNIFVDFDYQNVFLVDPNKTVDLNGVARERQIHHENLVMYANLEATNVFPRTKLAVGAPLTDAIQNVPIAAMNFLRPGGKTLLTNAYLDEITGLNTSTGKGTNQPNITNVSQQNKTDEFYLKQNTINSQDTGLLGIESIRVKNNRSATPSVEMTLIDTQGRALFEKGENSEYAAFFNLPYPTFYLTLKGYYGKAIRYQLILTKFSAAFDGNTGNYRINLNFYSYKYTVLAETQVGALFAVPFMYTSDFKINATAPQTGALNAAQNSVVIGNSGGQQNATTVTSNVRTTRGYQKIKEVYARYKADQLISPTLPELSFPELRARLEGLEKFLIQSFGQADFTPLSDVDTYFKLVTKFSDDVSSPVEDSWFRKYVDVNLPFILKPKTANNQTGVKTWIYNTATRDNPQKRIDAYNELRQLVTEYETQLLKNKTLGENGSFTIDGVKQGSQINVVKNIKVSPSTTLYVSEDTFRKAISEDDIDWYETFVARNNREPGTGEKEILKTQSRLFFIPLETQGENQQILQPTFNFVFDGKGNFSDVISKTFDEISKQKEKIVAALTAFLAKKIEGPNGLGFKPTMRNIMAMIFASIEAFYRLMDDVHSDAWSKRLHPYRKAAVYGDEKSNTTTDSKNLTQTTNTPNLSNIPVYPWPQYYVQTNSDKGEQYELRYPGDPREISRTKANNFDVWPEVEFVEEYMKGLAQRSSPDTGPSGDNNEGSSINKITVNAVEFPTTNIPYTDYDTVKFLYEIYERVLLATYWDRISTSGATSLSVYNTLSDLEVTNIRQALTGTSPALTKTLKNLAFTPNNYLGVLRQISNDGTGTSWQQFIRGIFTSEYLRTITTVDYAILEDTLITAASSSTEKSVDSLKNLDEYVKSTKSTTTDIMDVYPFRSEIWSKQYLSNFAQSKSNRYKTYNSLYVNTTKKYITNYQVGTTDNNQNKPFVNGSFLKSLSPEVTTTFDNFYSTRRASEQYLPTEGPLDYSAKTGNVVPLQTVSMMNTPFFINALQQDVQADRSNNVTSPYIKSAYLFLNSLPLATVSERYFSLDTESNTGAGLNEFNQLDYIFATLTKFGAIHRLPYAWILKYGSIWHRYKTYIDTNVDMLDSVWTNVNAGNIYNPSTNSLQTQYTFNNQKNESYNIVGQLDNTVSGNTISIMNLGFYPKLMNDVFYLIAGQDLLTGYTNTDIQNAVTEGLNVGPISDSSIALQNGFDTNNPNRSLNMNVWFSSFDTKNSTKFKPFQQLKTILIPSFGTKYNQIRSECFTQSTTGNTLSLTQEVFNNSAVYNGSARTFWTAPNYGYFELQSINKPRYDEYFKEIYSGATKQTSVKFGQTYTKIEDVFGTFKKDILDSFENEFLNFTKSYNDLSAEQISGSTFINRNFQSIMGEMLTVSYVDNTQSYDNYVTTCNTSQRNKISNMIGSFMNYNIAFKYGNPSNFDRKLFGTFTTLPEFKVIDPYTYNPYVQNTLPTATGTLTLSQSVSLNPDAWKAMYNYVGFATQSGMTYSNNGSYYTDFFPTMNVEFTQANVVNFAPLIKIFGTQKLLDESSATVYGSSNFTTSINEYYQSKNVFLNNTLTQLFSTLQKDLPNVEQTNEKPILSAVDGIQTKIEFWETFKAFNDKWIAGSNYKDRTLFQDVLFLDRANRDIGDAVYVDIFKLKDFFSGTTSLDTRCIDFVSRIIADNQFQMMPMPAYINFWGVGDVKQGETPNAQPTNDMANSLFGTFLDVDYRFASPKFVCYYAGKPSEHLDMRENPEYRWKTDAFDFAPARMPLIDKLQGKKDWAQSNRVVAFNVDFGTRNQSMFYSIQLDQNSAAATTEGNKVITDAANQAGGTRSNTQNVSLYNLYKTRSYECRVESMGNAMIQPTMYFNLRYVPMFRGPYMIQSVEHSIDAGQFKTFFTGIRMPLYSLPLIEQQIMTLNTSLLAELVQEVRRLKETAITTIQPAVNVITIGNSVQLNGKFTASDAVECLKDIQSANVRYRKYDGVENTIQRLSYGDMAKLLKENVSSIPTRALIFYTSYLNGHDDNNFVTFNFDLGGTPLGGIPYPQISYAAREEFFTKTYACKTNKAGSTGPFAVFTNYENSINFIESYYFNKQGGASISLINDKNNKWVTKQDYIDSMVRTQLLWWPTKKFNTPEEQDTFAAKNANTLPDLRKAASEVLEIMIKFNLVSF
jgi:hypothetical protein